MDGFDLGQSLENALTEIVNFLPLLIAAIIILLIGWLVAKVFGGVTRRLLQKLRFDRAMHNSPAGDYVARLVESPSRFLGKVVYWLIMLFVISMAISALRLPLLNDIVQAVYEYIPRIIGAVVIFLVASAIAGGAARFVQRVMGRTPTAKLIATVVPVVTLSIAAFMILNQLGIATDIVNILFTAIVGAIALGMALAFGLGGRDVAKDLLQQAYDASRDNSARLQTDIKMASENTKREANRVKRNV
jgi:small-conductance mechanosensitive channel